MNLNRRALRVADLLVDRAQECKVAAHAVEQGGRVIDCGIAVRGGLNAGLALARVCLADLADVTIVPGTLGGRACPMVQVVTDHPVRACLASQYAGWAISEEKYFAMGSGPMRAAAAREPIFATMGHDREESECVVGVLETRKQPTPAVVAKIAAACHVAPSAVTLLVAPTASLAGGLQIVARSIETALHKLAELGFDLSRIESAQGTAPLPPVAVSDLAAIGRTNDAILYGARVVLWVTGDDDSLRAIGSQVPSTSSRDYGEPFSAIFTRYNHDFYAVDPHLFSPAEVVFHNLETGHVHAFGTVAEDILVHSFFF